MRLKRNTTITGICKFSLIEHNKNDHIEHGLPNTENEFFVLKLKDIHAYPALMAYLESITNMQGHDKEYARDILDLAQRAGVNSKWCKYPD